MTRRAAVYVRISEDRTGAGLGVQRQLEDCEALAERLGWRVVETYVDNDVSAFTGKPRPAYRRLLTDLDAGRADAVLVWHTDRLHRHPRELEDYVDLCERRGIVTQAVRAGELDLSTPTGRMVARILGSVSRQEVEHKSERTKRAHLQAAQQGRWRGGARPFGYEPDGVTVREDEAAEVRRLTAAVLRGQSLGSLARDLNDRGVVSTTGKPWEFTTLRQLLLRPRNAGLSKYRGEVVAPGAWPALVPEQTWRDVVAHLTEPGRRTVATNAPKWLLSGLALCGVCGERVRTGSAVSNRRTGAKRTIYRCRGEGVGHVSRSATPVDEFVTDLVLARLGMPDAQGLLHAESVDTAALREQAAGLRARLDGLAELYADGVLTDEQVSTATARLRARLADVEATAAAAPANPVATRLLEGPAEALAERWETLEARDRRAVVDLLLVVRLLPQGKRGSAFDAATVRIEWRTA